MMKQLSIICLSVLVYGGQLWRAFETCPPGNENWKSVVVAGNLNRDLLDPASWRIPGRVLGKDGAVPPSEKIILGGMGLGSRGGDIVGHLGEGITPWGSHT